MLKSNARADMLQSPRRRVARAKTSTRADATARPRARERCMRRRTALHQKREATTATSYTASTN
eukprot:10597785-Alexandrium_andersonii.AAC.1